MDGQKTVTLKGGHIADEFQAIVEAYVAKTYGEGGRLRRAREVPAAPVRKVVPLKAIPS